jgi:phage shock protein A
MQTGLAPSENAAKAAVNAKLEEAQAATDVKVDAVSEKVERVAAEVGRVVLDVADLKTLMAQLVEQTKPPR